MALRQNTDLVGHVFSRLKVIDTAGRNKHDQKMYRCLCECGKKIVTRGTNLTSGRTKSCGCYALEKQSELSTKHGLHKHPLYAVWAAMKDRCYNTKHPAYTYYGGRGIRVCDSWLDDFKDFYDWAMESGYRTGLTLDRYPDQNGNYEPTNCRWATRSEQSQNLRSTRIEKDQIPFILSDTRSNRLIAEAYGVNESTISRIKSGKTWSNISKPKQSLYTDKFLKKIAKPKILVIN